MLEVFEPGEVYPGSSVETEKQWEEYVTHNINIGVSFFFFFFNRARVAGGAQWRVLR